MSLGPHAQKLFDDARRDLSPTEDDAKRNYARLMATVGTAAAVGVAGAAFGASGKGGVPVAATSVAKASLWLATAKIVLPALVVIGAGAATATIVAPRMHARRVATTSGPTSVQRSSPASSPSPPQPTPPPARTDDAPAVSVDALPVVSSRPVPAKAEEPAPSAANGPARPEDDLTAEVALVRRIHEAQGAGNHRLVLELAREHERRFPLGRLVEERDAARTSARCSDPAEGLSAAAKAGLGARFGSDYPRSSHLANVKRVCGDAR